MGRRRSVGRKSPMVSRVNRRGGPPRRGAGARGTLHAVELEGPRILHVCDHVTVLSYLINMHSSTVWRGILALEGAEIFRFYAWLYVCIYFAQSHSITVSYLHPHCQHAMSHPHQNFNVLDPEIGTDSLLPHCSIPTILRYSVRPSRC